MKTNIEKSSWLMKVLSVTIMLAFIAPVMTNAQAGKANFSGNWTFNAEKSTQPPSGGQGGGQRMGGGNFVVTQDANLLTVVRTRTGQDGQPQTTTMKYTLDGKESINTSPRGDSKSVATWSADGKSLSIATSRTFDRNGEQMTINTTEVWAVNGAVLTVVSTTKMADGDRVMTNVYDKK
jgi:Tol biopolymer transport system component